MERGPEEEVIGGRAVIFWGFRDFWGFWGFWGFWEKAVED